MKEKAVRLLSFLKISKSELLALLEVPKNSDMGDYALPCFVLARKFKKNPVEIAKDISLKIKLDDNFEKVEAAGPYVNFFVNKEKLAKEVIKKISKEKDLYGSNTEGKRKKVVIEMSSPNIAKPFGIGHLRSTIIGNSISKIYEFNGYKTVKINHLGDWGTQFGRLIVGYKRFGNTKKLKNDPIGHMLEIYIKANKKDYDDEAREWFKKLEDGNKEATALWKKFRELSIKYFEKIYSDLSISFDAVSGESSYNNKIDKIIDKLEEKKLLEESEGALIVNLKKHDSGVALIKKKDGATLYITRDLAAAIERYGKYGFDKMIYEVGSEQKLHFKQLFKILELMNYKWADKCVHVDHGLYLGGDGKKFSTRKGKTVFMDDVLGETVKLSLKEIKKRTNLPSKEAEERAKKIAISAIFYGDLKNYRSNDAVFDIENFLSFEGDTGPYLLYSYARGRSILKKAHYKKYDKFEIEELDDCEKKLVKGLFFFPDRVREAYENLAPNIIANYAYELAKTFNEFYHGVQVIESENEGFRLSLVSAFSQTLKNALSLLGIGVIKEM